MCAQRAGPPSPRLDGSGNNLPEEGFVKRRRSTFDPTSQTGGHVVLRPEPLVGGSRPLGRPVGRLSNPGAPLAPVSYGPPVGQSSNWNIPVNRKAEAAERPMGQVIGTVSS